MGIKKSTNPIFIIHMKNRTPANKSFACRYSAATSGWAGWALAHPEFGSSVNPITTRGADYTHPITASPPGLENLVAALLGNVDI